MPLFCNVGDDLCLIPVSEEQADMIHGFASKPNVKKYIGWRLKESLFETQEFVETLVARHEGGTHVYASVAERQSMRVIGMVMLFNFDEAAGHGEIGYLFDDSVWGRGYGSQVVQVMTSYALNELGLRKLFARIAGSNVGSLRILEKNGYTLEAELKDYYRIDNRHQNCMVYSRYAEQR